MKRLLLFILPLLALTFISCKPEEEEKPKKLVKTVEFINLLEVGTLLHTYYYDNLNRLIKRKESFNNNVNGGYYTFNYSTNTITVYPDIEPFTWYLDENGYLIDDTNNSTYIYENGYLKEYKVDNSFRVEYSWINGNNVQITHFSEYLVSATTICECSNKEDLLNIEPLFILQHFHPLPIFGLRLKGWTSKNYLTKWTFTDTNPDNPSTTIRTYDYTFDTDGYPTQIIVNSTDNEQVNPTGKILLTYY